MNAFSLLFAPAQTIVRIKSTPRWLWTFIQLSALSIVVYIFAHPFLINATLAHLPSTATQEEKEFVAQTLRSELPLRCFFLPVRLLVGWTSFAAVLFLVGKSFAPPEPLHFNKLFSLEVHAELINTCAQAAILLRLLIAQDTSTEMTSLTPFSAAMFVKGHDIVTLSLLDSLNIFALAYLAILTMGISIQSGFSRAKSFFIVFITWSVYLLFNIGSIKLMRDTMHLLL